VDLARRQRVEFRFKTELVDVVPSGPRFVARTSRGDLEASAVVLATGGLSVPATGSTGTGLTVARALGHVVHDTYPALTPLVASPPIHASLAGVSLNVRVRARAAGAGDTEAHGGFLFTHRGYSGPSVLDISHVAIRSLAAEESRTERVKGRHENAFGLIAFDHSGESLPHFVGRFVGESHRQDV
jgi:hypothetical protein